MRLPGEWDGDQRHRAHEMESVSGLEDPLLLGRTLVGKLPVRPYCPKDGGGSSAQTGETNVHPIAAQGLEGPQHLLQHHLTSRRRARRRLCGDAL